MSHKLPVLCELLHLSDFPLSQTHHLQILKHFEKVTCLLNKPVYTNATPDLLQIVPVSIYF